IAARVRSRLAVEHDRRRGIAVVEFATGVENLRHVFGDNRWKTCRLKGRRFQPRTQRLRAIASIVGQYEIDVCAPPYRPIETKTVDRREVTWLEAESMRIEGGQRLVRDSWRVKRIGDRGTRRRNPSWLILEPRLVCGDFARLRRQRAGPEILLGLPTL